MLKPLSLAGLLALSLLSCGRNQDLAPEPPDDAAAASRERRADAEAGADEEELTRLRHRLVDALVASRSNLSEVEVRAVTDPKVIAALKKVPRHEFVPERLRRVAYEDRALPIGEEQTISQPYIVALMTGLLELEEGAKVLEIGTGSGYQGAVLAEIAGSVYTIEIIPELARRARGVLERLGYENISYRIGDGYRGWPEVAPFDGILVTAAPDHVPRALLDQLKVGARLVIPVGASYQVLKVFTRTETGFDRLEVAGVRFVPMTGEAREE